MRKILIGIAIAFAATTGANAAVIQTGIGGNVSDTNDKVLVTFISTEAGYNSDLYLFTDDGIADNDIFLFNNKAASPDDSIILSGLLGKGELIFRLLVNNTTEEFFSGDAARNSDNVEHASVDLEIATGVAIIGFKDILGGGDNDFNDIIISVADLPVPLSCQCAFVSLLG